MKKMLLFALVVIPVIVFAGIKTSRSGYESAAYRVISTEGKFEIRDYEAHTLVITPVGGGTRTERDGGFGRLFKYISGQNEREQKIAMTTPVFMDKEAEGQETMAFVVPADVSAPAASGKEVTVENVEPRRYATFRFKGYGKPEKVNAAREALLLWVEQKGMRAVGEMREAYYDPPWTPQFLRRNEVLIPVIE